MHATSHFVLRVPFKTPSHQSSSHLNMELWTNHSGCHRDRSPSLQSDKISESREVKRWIDKYLGVGEWIMDQSVAVLGSSSYFERRR